MEKETLNDFARYNAASKFLSDDDIAEGLLALEKAQEEGRGEDSASDFTLVWQPFESETVDNLLELIEAEENPLINFFTTALKKGFAPPHPDLTARDGFTQNLEVDFRASGGGGRIALAEGFRELASYLENASDEELLERKDQFENSMIAAYFKEPDLIE
jgi:hypothetical protein